jgi:hypothetical protein
MWQIFHIMKKDVRCLFAEIGLLVACNIANVWMQAHHPDPSIWYESCQLLTIMAAAHLITRVVHAEALVGDKQFWITRPYRWQSLLTAKLTFIVLFASLPVFLTYAAALTFMGFSPESWFAPLASASVRLFVVALLAAALACVTRGTAQFTLLGLLALFCGAFLFERTFGRWSLESLPEDWPLLATAAAAIALSILLVEYRTRWTVAGRTLGVGACLLWAPLLTSMPATNRPFVETDPEPQESSTVELKVEFIRPASVVASMEQPQRFPSFSELFASVQGIPDGFGIAAYRFGGTFQGASGRQWRIPKQPFQQTEFQNANKTAVQNVFYTPASFADDFKDEVDRPGMLRLSIEMQLVKLHTKTVILTRTPIDVIAGLQCYLKAREVVCRAPRWPAVYLRVFSAGKSFEFGSTFINGGFGLDLLEERAANSLGSEVTFHYGEPTGWFVRDMEINGVRPVDLIPTR